MELNKRTGEFLTDLHDLAKLHFDHGYICNEADALAGAVMALRLAGFAIPKGIGYDSHRHDLQRDGMKFPKRVKDALAFYRGYYAEKDAEVAKKLVEGK